MKVWRLRSSLWIPHPPGAVFPFFADARNLQRLTPPWLSFRILSPVPDELRVGALIDYRIRVRGVPISWRTRISRWDPPHAFADEQIRGPYALWSHTHTFEAFEGGTLLGDDVAMRPRGGPLAPLLMAAFVKRDVERIFRYRAEVMAEQFGGRLGAGELSWREATVDPGEPSTAAS